MGIAILLFCFISIFLSLGISAKMISKKELLIVSALSFSAIVVFLVEVLSLFHQLNYQFLLIGWSVTTLALIIFLYRNNQRTRDFTSDLWIATRQKISDLTKADKALFTASTLILVLVFIAAIIYPPNNWDAMTYHMARITSWVSHQSVAHYPTDITRQLYQPPFAEYVIMNFGILCRSDVFSNLVQFISLLFSVITVVSIVEQFGLNRQYKIIAIVLSVTIPEVLLQAGSTQNDIVVAFFVLTAFLFAVKTIKQPMFKNYLCLGLATGLALLTKGTAYIYLPPVLLFFGIIVVIQLLKTKNYWSLGYSFAAIVIVIGLNFGHFSRNYQLTHNILGVDKAESNMYSNQKMSAALLASSIVKNAGMHTGVMLFKPAAIFSDKVIHRLHQIAGLDINDTAVNYRNLKYTTITLTTDEEGSPNPFHFILIIISTVLIIYNLLNGRRNVIVTSLLAILLLQAIFFCYYLKWQPWHSRLHIEMFLIAVPLICYCLSLYSWFRKAFYWLSPLLMIYALLVVLHTERRPFSNKMFQPGYQKYFIGNIPIYNEYNSINSIVQKSSYKNIGLIFGVDDWEYPLFSRCFSRQLNPLYIGVNNFSKSAKADMVKIDCIISTTANKPFIDYEGKRYVNTSVKNKIIWFYK
ncbi:glycosyltransferase family 39 protein [Mucilaginibacter sp. BJC16-A38]|uniref:glycosyltransferase family 39 protein n=1 Tax=Mucilaginibacter phenanthrenivorans TaxID=1234842 RepID=UPI002157CCD5|nr:glycosyltransferase family 39 protein [Mucilaginibacter phenanthrenivorans]MCR8561304.1 glycosyltransferase family 39 protein [Mucilaginibacter phenanthrenivorans]